MHVVNKKWSTDQFLSVRKEILQGWPTGSDHALDLDKAVENLRQVPDHKQFASKLLEAKQNHQTLIQPRAGVARLDEHIDLLLHLEQAGADFLPSTIDSYTRHNRYEEAEEGIRISMREGRSFLNGFPAVNHGVAGCKKVYDAVGLPLQARHGTPDGRLLAEIIHAAGWTSNEGGGISYNIPYAKSIPLSDSIYYWQYADRLVGYYEEHGIRLNREPFGPLTGTLVPPSIAITIGVIEALLAAEQGVRSITVGYGQSGNITQDVAAIDMLESLTEQYLFMFGYRDVEVTTVFHQWMGGFPKDQAEAAGLIGLASMVASLAGATKMITKTTSESVGVPTKEVNAWGIRESKLVTRLLEGQHYPESDALETERMIIKAEVENLMGHILDVGNNDIAQGVIKAFEMGIIDVPFAPSKHTKNLILPARDNEGAIRILEFGNLGMNHEIKSFHTRKLEERAMAEGRDVSFQMTIDDVYAVSQGRLIGRPKEMKR
ncbi:MAG: methylaspartate mutase subunit E [Acholeplasmataceae bacterium]|nr:methylaspartate mutase subunit E [Acholeplasmataceae bacterium]